MKQFACKEYLPCDYTLLLAFSPLLQIETRYRPLFDKGTSFCVLMNAIAVRWTFKNGCTTATADHQSSFGRKFWSLENTILVGKAFQTDVKNTNSGVVICVRTKLDPIFHWFQIADNLSVLNSKSYPRILALWFPHERTKGAIMNNYSFIEET